MNKRIGLILLLTLIAGVTVVPTVSACSVTHVATAAEITEGADVILLVRVPAVTVTNISSIEMAVVEVLKGNYKPKTVPVWGQTAQYEGGNERTAPYDFVRKGGRHGDCFANDYKSGGQFLLFLKNGEVHWSPLAATNEEVSGPKDPWVVWVKDRLKPE